MKICLFGNYGKRITAILGVIVLVGIISFGYTMAKGYLEAKVSRSNALQVSKPVVEQIPQTIVPDFFTEYRLERDRIRSERSDMLREVMKTAKSDEMRHKAQNDMLQLVKEKEKEAEMENLIKAKGFTDALVFVRDNSVSAVIKASSLTKEEVLQVADVIIRISGVKQENITITAKP